MVFIDRPRRLGRGEVGSSNLATGAAYRQKLAPSSVGTTAQGTLSASKLVGTIASLDIGSAFYSYGSAGTTAGRFARFGYGSAGTQAGRVVRSAYGSHGTNAARFHRGAYGSYSGTVRAPVTRGNYGSHGTVAGRFSRVGYGSAGTNASPFTRGGYGSFGTHAGRLHRGGYGSFGTANAAFSRGRYGSFTGTLQAPVIRGGYGSHGTSTSRFQRGGYGSYSGTVRAPHIRGGYGSHGTSAMQLVRGRYGSFTGTMRSTLYRGGMGSFGTLRGGGLRAAMRYQAGSVGSFSRAIGGLRIGSYTSQVALGLNVARQPSTTRDTYVVASGAVTMDKGESGRITWRLSGDNPPTTERGYVVGGINSDQNIAANALTVRGGASFIVPAGQYYLLGTFGDAAYSLVYLQEMLM